MKTTENLKAAFAGESQANRKYLAFAKKAEAEGHYQIARLFRATAEAETIHAHGHLDVLGDVGPTTDNIKAAIEGETYEFTQMYPKFLEEAKTEENKDAVISFYRANEVEKIHNQLFTKALENFGNNEQTDYYVCQVCGHTVEGEAPEICPICGAKKIDFKLVD